MPTAQSAITTFAPATLRERNSRSGMSGLAMRACRATNAASSADRHAAQRERPRRAPAVLADPRIV